MSSPLLNEKCCFLAESVAGDPTHYLFEQALKQAEMEWRFLSFEIPPEDLAVALAGLEVLGFQGVKLSGGFCSAAAESLASLTDRARRAGSANCISMHDDRLVGDDTYGAAFVEAIGGTEALAGKEVVVIGGERSARAIAFATCDAGAATLFLADDQEDALAELVEQVAADAKKTTVEALAVDGNVVHVPEGVDVLVFAPAGDGDAPQMVIDTDGRDLTIVDTRLRGSRTGLLSFAEERGATAIDGVDLFACDTALTLELWTGMEFDRTPLRELAEEYLGF